MNTPHKIITFLDTLKLPYETEVNLKGRTWIKRGGIAKIWVQPNSLTDFENLVVWCQSNAVPHEIIGGTSNCYFLNDYNPDLVISTLKLTRIAEGSETITCECGVNMSRLAKFCISKGISGYEGFIGLPGTVGGAVINNSGCYGSSISSLVISVAIIAKGKKQLLTNEELKYSFRNSVLKSKDIDGVVTEVTFSTVKKDDPSFLAKRAQEFQIHRKNFQEHSYPNLGSTFCIIELKEFSLAYRIVNSIAHRLINIIIKKPVNKQKAKTRLFLTLKGAGRFRKYVSHYGIGCFTWKDAGADKAFKEYLAFIYKNSIKAILEIEVKK
jgi:UDP-N-acetylmuramate dehydrogenase